jgi:hypothetical protein
MTTITDLDDFKALEPFFRIIEHGLDGIADGGHFFDLLAENVIFDYIITTPGYPRHQHRRGGDRVRLRGPSRRDRRPLRQPVHLGPHDHRPQGHTVARLP